MSDPTRFYCTVKYVTADNDNGDDHNDNAVHDDDDDDHDHDHDRTVRCDGMMRRGSDIHHENSNGITTIQVEEEEDKSYPCHSSSDNNTTRTISSLTLILRPDHEKKSVFWFDPPATSTTITSTVTTESTAIIATDTSKNEDKEESEIITAQQIETNNTISTSATTTNHMPSNSSTMMTDNTIPTSPLLVSPPLHFPYHVLHSHKPKDTVHNRKPKNSTTTLISTDNTTTLLSSQSWYECSLTCHAIHNDNHGSGGSRTDTMQKGHPDEIGDDHGVLHHIDDTDTHTVLSTSKNHHIQNHQDFMMAGFQLISNAPQVQVYLLTSPSTSKKENRTKNNNNNRNNNNSNESDIVDEVLLTTVKGIPIVMPSGTISSFSSNISTNKNDNTNNVPKLYKTQCVIPGGPRPVRRARLVFQSLSTTNTPSTIIQICDQIDEPPSPPPLFLKFIRWTIRIPTMTSNTSDAVMSSNTIAPNPIPHHPFPFSFNPTTTSNTPPLPSTFPFFPPPMTIPSSDGAPSLIPPPTSHDKSYTTSNNNNHHNNTNNNELLMAISGIALTMKSMEERIMKQASTERSVLQVQMTQLSQQVQSLSNNVEQYITQQQQFLQHQLPDMITSIVQEQLRIRRQLSPPISKSPDSSPTVPVDHINDDDDDKNGDE
jgi:hypothetical protein